MVKSNLKEFVIGFFGIKEDPECKEKIELIFSQSDF